MLSRVLMVLFFAGCLIAGMTLPRVLSDWAMAQILRGIFIVFGILAFVAAYYVPAMAYNLPR